MPLCSLHTDGLSGGELETCMNSLRLSGPEEEEEEEEGGGQWWEGVANMARQKRKDKCLRNETVTVECYKFPLFL